MALRPDQATTLRHLGSDSELGRTPCLPRLLPPELDPRRKQTPRKPGRRTPTNSCPSAIEKTVSNSKPLAESMGENRTYDLDSKTGKPLHILNIR